MAEEELYLAEDVQLWSFRGTTFAVRLTSENDWDEWFEQSLIMTVDPILDSPDRFVDIGGSTFSEEQRLCAFNTPEERALFEQMIGSEGLLSRPGASRQALLSKVRRVSSGTNAFYLLSATFTAT